MLTAGCSLTPRHIARDWRRTDGFPVPIERTAATCPTTGERLQNTPRLAQPPRLVVTEAHASMLG
jgi:hypothetical protein